jgi:RHS repeat-associated protein
MNRYSVTPFGTDRFDRNGNLIGAANEQMAYDYRNQLVSVAGPGGTALFKYDCFGRRIQRTSNSGTVSFYYDDNYILQENIAGGGTNTFVSGGSSSGSCGSSSANETVSMLLSNQIYFLANDDLGSARQVTDIEGNLSESYHYSDFGVPSVFNGMGAPISKSMVGNRYLFGGRPYDPETGLYNYPARYYDPNVGRFTTADPIGSWGDALNSGNGYTYVDNNPLTFTDPTGLVNNLYSWNPYANNLYSYNPYANNLYSWNPYANNLYAFNPYANNLYYGPWGIFGAFRQVAGRAYGFEPLQAGRLFLFKPTTYANWIYPQMPRYAASFSCLSCPFGGSCLNGCGGGQPWFNLAAAPVANGGCRPPVRIKGWWGWYWQCDGNCNGGASHCAIEWNNGGGWMPNNRNQDWWMYETKGTVYRCTCTGFGPRKN